MFDGADSSRQKQKEERRIFKRRMQMRDREAQEIIDAAIKGIDFMA